MRKNLKKSKYIVLGIIITVGLALAIGILWHVFHTQEENNNAGMSYQLDENAEEWDASGVTPQDDTSGIKIPGYGTIYFASGSREQSITLYNPKENTCYFVFSLSIDDDTVLYESGYVEPGKAISEVKLSEAPQAGEHTLYITISTYDLETEMALNNAVVKCDLQVG